MALSSLKRQTAASSGVARPTNRSGYEAGSKISCMGRRTCVSASALSLDAQPAQAERVVRRISRPVWGIGIMSPKNKDLTGRFAKTCQVWCINFLLDWHCACSGIGQRQNKLIAAWDKDGLYAGCELQNILILQQGRCERLR